MPSIFIDQNLAARLEDAQAWRAVHYAQACASQSDTDSVEILTVAGAPVIYGGGGVPINRAIGVGMHGVVTANDLERIESFYFQRCTDAIIDLCPLADTSLLVLLKRRDYYLRNWMSMLFLPLPHTAAALNAKLAVSRATPEQADLWLNTSGRGFDENDDVSAETQKILYPNFHAANAHCYFVWLDDIPIATGGMYAHGGVVELGGTSTLVSYRNQGAQRALIQQRLSDAYAMGCDLAAVLATPGSASQRNLQRIGFQLAYSRAIYVRPYPLSSSSQ